MWLGPSLLPFMQQVLGASYMVGATAGQAEFSSRSICKSQPEANDPVHTRERLCRRCRTLSAVSSVDSFRGSNITSTPTTPNRFLHWLSS